MTKFLEPLASWKFWKELLFLTLGTLIAAASIYYFQMPCKLAIGSISGLAIIINAFAAKFGVNLDIPAMIFIMNAVLLLLGYVLVGKEFGIKTVYTALLMGPLIKLLDIVMPYTRLAAPGQASVMGDIWLDLCCFILILSISQAILFRMNASTGGLDIVAKIINKYFHTDIGASVTVAGLTISLMAFTIHPFNIVMIGIVGTWINGLVIDYFSATLNRRKRVCIISDEHQKINDFITHKLVRGCTLYDIRGGYNGERHTEIQALMSQDEFASLMKFISDSGIKAFITAGNVSEVYGLWFGRSTQKKLKE